MKRLNTFTQITAQLTLLACCVLALSSTEVKSVTPLGQQPMPEHVPDPVFPIEKEVWATPFKSQAQTLTCWSFATTSFLESEAHRLGRGDFELSPMFNVYHAYLEKALRNVRTHGTNRFNTGGLSHDVIQMIRAHGAVPRTAYTGLMSGEERLDQLEMYGTLAGLVGGAIKSGEENPVSGRWNNGVFAAKWFEVFRGAMNAYMGPAPVTVPYEGRSLTPRQFADELLRLPLDDYVEITSYSHLPFFGQGELLVEDNWQHLPCYNVPLVVNPFE